VWHGALRVVGDAQAPDGAEAGFCMVLRGDWRWIAPAAVQGSEPRVLQPGQGLWWSEAGAAVQGRLEPVPSDGAAEAPALVWIALERGPGTKY
jgi:uncharacterized protein